MIILRTYPFLSLINAIYTSIIETLLYSLVYLRKKTKKTFYILIFFYYKKVVNKNYWRELLFKYIEIKRNTKEFILNRYWYNLHTVKIVSFHRKLVSLSRLRLASLLRNKLFPVLNANSSFQCRFMKSILLLRVHLYDREAWKYDNNYWE